jgi:5-methylcytosine-specific restriction endonuclease McrA
MESALLLNATYEPLRVVSWKKAITLVTLGKVEVIEEYEREVRSISFTIRLPSIIRLIRYVRKKKGGVKFSRQNIYARDKNQCQYCGRKLTSEELTYDHVIPRSMGGRTEWHNIVTCCMECNRHKGGKTPREAGMKLLRKPSKPEWLPILRITINIKQAPESWFDYLYWNVELES